MVGKIGTPGERQREKGREKWIRGRESRFLVRGEKLTRVSCAQTEHAVKKLNLIDLFIRTLKLQQEPRLQI